ncbi:MAG: alpha/beta hydrolase [Pseudomonadota bacterium]
MTSQQSAASIKHASIQLGDGRRLGYSETAASGDSAVLYLHGNPGSRREVLRPAYLAAFKRAGLRVISIDRPGYGDSDPPLEKGHLPFARDIEVLMDQLGLPSAVVVGHSRGTLPAISLGVRLPDRITAVGVFGPTGLPDDRELMRSQSAEARLMLQLVRSAPAFARSLFRVNSWVDRQFPAGAARRMARFMSSAADRAQLQASGQTFVETLAAGMRRDPAFAIDDWRSWLVDPLGFDPTSLRQPLLLWIGSEDGLCPARPVHHMAARIAGAQLRSLPGLGHLHTPEVLVELMQATLSAEASAPGHRPKRR